MLQYTHILTPGETWPNNLPKKENTSERIEKYEYRNATDEKICDVEATIEFVENEEEQKTILRSLFLVSMLGERIDFLKFMELPKTYRIVIDEHGDPACDHKESTIVIQGLSTPLQLATLAHEIGHSLQHFEKNFSDLGYGMGIKFSPKDIASANEIAKLNTLTNFKLDHALVQKLVTMKGDLDSCLHRQDEAHQIWGKQLEIFRALYRIYFTESLSLIRASIDEEDFEGMLRDRGIQMSDWIEEFKKIPKEEIKHYIDNFIQGTEGYTTLGVDITPEELIVLLKIPAHDKKTKDREIFLPFHLKGDESPLSEKMQESVLAYRQAFTKSALERATEAEIREEYERTVAPHTKTISALLRSTTIILEQDATKRAIITLKKLQELGIDLLQPLKVLPVDKEKIEKRNLELSLQLGEGRVFNSGMEYAIRNLNSCLVTYSADRESIRRDYHRPLKLKAKKPKKS
ncbi:MAG: hypothetical protein AAB473_04565 [Patescibacteria group bacterium]|mgnify:CR=1 FL=1